MCAESGRAIVRCGEELAAARSRTILPDRTVIVADDQDRTRKTHVALASVCYRRLHP
jgi:hypothetical protein